MPEMDGYQTTQYIKENFIVQPVIIAMTANAMDGDKDKCLNAGMEDYISKPINFDELSAKIEQWAKHVYRHKKTVSV